MLFQSPIFFLFFAVFATCLCLTPNKWVKALTIVASLVFYSHWYPPYTILLLGLMVYSWLACHVVSRNRRALPLFIILSLVPLFFYKYTGFVLGAIGLDATIAPQHLPLGISFVTFTIISMVVDVSKSGKSAPGLVDTSLYVSFFPHLISGPILRSWQMIPQLSAIRITWDNLRRNLPLFASGMVKKVIFSDAIARCIDPVYAAPAQFSSTDLAVAAFGFTIQIYCDFSAYSDMAIALAGMFGIRFPENFKSPYLSVSLSEFWRRWHMTLSFWLRDYVFMPLHRSLGNRLRHLPILLTMIVSGLWHGAGWTFIVWGIVEGLVMMVESYTKYTQRVMRHKTLRIFCILPTFLLIILTNIIFRSTSLTKAWHFYAGIADFSFTCPTVDNYTVLGIGAIILALHPFDQVDHVRNTFAKISPLVSIPVILGIIAGCCLLGASRPQSFYYFDF